MMRAQFSTANVPSADQADAWHRWYSPVFEITPKKPSGEHFLARNDVWSLGGLVVSHVVAPPVATVRARANLVNTPVDHWVLGYCKRGATSLETSRSALRASPKSLFLWSLGEPSCGEQTEVDRVEILLPRDMFPEIREQLDALRVSVLDTPSGSVLGEYMMALSRWLPNLEPDAEVSVMEAVHNMILACLAPNVDNIKRAENDMRDFLIDRVRQMIHLHLRSPSLGPDVLCKLVGMSRSSLYRLFMYYGGIMRYIQHQRLLHAHAILSDPLNRQSILAVAEDLCFPDASSFSRAFRREFGCCPTEVRDAAAMGTPVRAVSRLQDHGDIGRFADFLRAGGTHRQTERSLVAEHSSNLRH
jgi:AraC-type DNA-binding domain-containing proteins